MSIHLTTPSGRARRGRLILLCIILLVLTLLGTGAFLAFRQFASKFTLSTFTQSGISASPAPDGELIGISDGSYAFDTNRPDGNLKTAASTAFRKGDKHSAISDWNQAHALDSNDAEPLIYLQDQSVIASNPPYYITLVVGTMLTDKANGTSSAVSTGRDDLQGAYITQLTYNQGHLLPGGGQIVLLIANAGSHLTGSNPTYISGVAQQIVQAASHDKHIVGVMGWSFSGYALGASSVLGPAHIPMMSSAASSDALSKMPYFFRVVPPNKVQAVAGAQYAEQQLGATKAAVFFDPANSYSSTLANDFSNQFKSDGYQVVRPATYTYTVGQTKTFPTLLQDALQDGVDLIYFSGYSDDMSVLLTDISNMPSSSSAPSILGGDALYILKGYQSSSTAAFTRLHFTTFAYPDEWRYRNIPEPAFFVTYAHTYDPNGTHSNNPYTYDRPDDGAILANDATLTLLQGCINAQCNSAVTPARLYQGLTMITRSHPVLGVSGLIAFNANSDTPGDPLNKAIVVLSVDPQGYIQLSGQGGIQGCYQPGDPQC